MAFGRVSKHAATCVGKRGGCFLQLGFYLPRGSPSLGNTTLSLLSFLQGFVLQVWLTDLSESNLVLMLSFLLRLVWQPWMAMSVVLALPFFV